MLEPRLSTSSLPSSPDVLVCSTGSGLGPSGMTDRLLVASCLWAKGIRADYLPQDLWAPPATSTASAASSSRGARSRLVDPWSHHRSVMVDMSLEQLTRVCASLSVPFLVIIKAHTLRDQQSVKVRSVLDPSTSDVTVLLPQLARHISERLHHRQSHHHHHHHAGSAHGDHHHHHHHHAFPSLHSPGDTSRGAQHPTTPSSSHHGPGGSTWDLNIVSLDRGGAGASDKKKAFKEASALERRVRSHLEGLLGPTAASSSSSLPSAAKVFVLDVPYVVLREVNTSFLLLLAENGAAGGVSTLEQAMKPQHSGYRKPLKLLAEALVQATTEAEDRGKKGGSSGGGSVVVVYSLQDDAFDVLPVGIGQGGASKKTTAKGGGKAGQGHKR